MTIIKTFTIIGLFLISIMSLFSCSGQRPPNIGITDNKLSPCPASPNCVSSDASDISHKVPAFELKGSATDAWKLTTQTVSNLPRTKIITETSDYLHAECSSAIFGFVDDLELHLLAADGLISTRSASRLGYSDFGVNRKRIENLRRLLIDQKILNKTTTD